ncbi:hypothetical protein ONO57_27185, partial [Salmonella enterica subsp. enterica serovar Anatum]|nr:hypothetical protein [Salmonella enterica subsp. enterica serovar Anatum]
KLIYRPPALTKSTPDSQSQQLKWQTAGDVITVNNPTPYYMNFPVEQHLCFYSPIVLLNRPGCLDPGRNKRRLFHGNCLHIC